jgi:two-component system OmpR family response regulator
MLEQEGFAVVATSVGAEAVELARAARPELTILDVDLEDADGFEICRQIRAFHHGYLIIVSERDTEADKILGFTLGADDLTSKAVDSLACFGHGAHYLAELAGELAARQK